MFNKQSICVIFSILEPYKWYKIEVFCRHRQQQWRSPWFQNVSYSFCRYVVNTQWVHDLNWIKVIVQWPGQHELVIYFRFRSFLHRDFQLFDFIKALKGYNCPWHCFEKKLFKLIIQLFLNLQYLPCEIV